MERSKGPQKPSQVIRDHKGRFAKLTPAEIALAERQAEVDAIKRENLTGRWPLVWKDGAVYRDRLAQTSTLPVEASQAPQTGKDRTEGENVAPSAILCACDSDAPVTAHPGRFTASEIATLIGIAAVAVALFLASPLGAGVIAMVTK